MFDESRLQVTLIEAGARILPALPERLAKAAQAELEALGVQVLTEAKVVEARADGIVTSGQFVPADIMVWAAGVKAPEILKEIGGLETNRANQLVVLPTLQTTRDPAFSPLAIAAPAFSDGKRCRPAPRRRTRWQPAPLPT